MNVLIVSHSTFTGSSALHAYSIAAELERLGVSPAIVVPEDPATVEEIGVPVFPVVSYDEAVAGRLSFPDRGGPDLIHAFTPREHVREITERLSREHRCPYVVHLEDNEEAILAAELGVPFEELRRLPPSILDDAIGRGRTHPHHAEAFLEGASACSVVVDALLERVPRGLPAAVIRPGLDELLPAPARSREQVRAALEVGTGELVVLYTGSVHSANANEMFSLYLAIALARRDAVPVILVKTGWNWSEPPRLDALRGAVRDVGWVDRQQLPELLAAADILVQPGRPGAYTDFRFPSKLPDYLASGKPVVLPRANLGLELQNDVEAVTLERGDALEIQAAVTRLACDADLRASVGARGRSFALAELRWAKSVPRLLKLYERAVQEGPVVQRRRRMHVPVRLVLAPDAGFPVDSMAALCEDVFDGVCLDSADNRIERVLERALPFCLRFGAGIGADVHDLLLRPEYIRFAGQPLVLGGSTSSAVVLEKLPDPNALRRGAQYVGERLRAEPRATFWFRSAVWPEEPQADVLFRLWLRKLVLDSLVRIRADTPLVFIAANANRIDALAVAARAAADDGAQRYYAARGITLRESDPRRMEGAGNLRHG